MTDTNNIDNATITVNDKVYQVSDLSEDVKEMLGLHAQASQMAEGAKRQAVIHDLALQNISAMIEKALKDSEE